MEALKTLTDDYLFITNILVKKENTSPVVFTVNFKSKNHDKLFHVINEIVKNSFELSEDEYAIENDDRWIPKGNLKITNKSGDTVLHIIKYNDGVKEC